MSLRYKISVNLGVTAHNTEEDNPVNFKILTINNDAPSKFLYDNQQVEDVLNRIVSSTLETHPEWPKKHFCNCINSNGIIHLNYLTIIPDEVRNKRGEWVTLFDVVGKSREVKQNYHHIIKHINQGLINQHNA